MPILSRARVCPGGQLQGQGVRPRARQSFIWSTVPGEWGSVSCPERSATPQ
ncbi:hypothetical protein DB31_2104 [Hyalangium minutum]|uniref:Uncharacterized protein n=1 Tax=Hyalangium minutum TaxID=394096 RepID=A0A085W9E7_9BACT|nr:hypothetical protein DB31_2104 [Hyalangium minutum]